MHRLFGIAVAGILALSSLPALGADAQIGDDAGTFVATTLDGKKFDLSTLKGKVVVINFWATWCRDCHFEMPALEAVWRQRRSAGLEALAVSVDQPEGRKHVNDVMRYFTYPAAMLGEVLKNELVTLTSVPVTYVIGKDGKVRDIIVPPLSMSNEAEFSAKIDDLLKEKIDDKPAAKTEEKTGDKAEAKTDKKE